MINETSLDSEGHLVLPDLDLQEIPVEKKYIYALTSSASLVILTSLIFTFSENYLQADPNNFIQAVKDFDKLIHYTLTSYRINSTMLSQGIDVAAPIWISMQTYIFLEGILLIARKISPTNLANKFPNMETEYQIKTSLAILVGCIAGTVGILTEFTGEYSSPLADFDPGDVLAFSIPLISALLYILLKILQKENVSHTKEDNNL